MAAQNLIVTLLGLMVAAPLALPSATAHTNTSCTALAGLTCTFDCNGGATVWISISGGVPGAFGSASCLNAVASCTVQLGATSCSDESGEESVSHWHNNGCSALGAVQVSCGAF